MVILERHLGNPTHDGGISKAITPYDHVRLVMHAHIIYMFIVLFLYIYIYTHDYEHV